MRRGGGREGPSSSRLKRDTPAEIHELAGIRGYRREPVTLSIPSSRSTISSSVP